MVTQVVQSDGALFAQANALFTQAFEHKERAFDLQEAHREGSQTLAVVQDGVLLAFANYREYEDFVYIEHIATLERLRGQSISAPLFGHFMKGYPYVLCELSVNSERISFYERIGFTLNPYDYVVPPYGGNTKAEKYLLYTYPRTLDMETFERFKKIIFDDAYLGGIAEGGASC